MNTKHTLPTRRALCALALALLFLGAGAPPLDPDFRPAAPEGWLVTGKRDGSYDWLRFSATAEIEGEDFRDDAITLYRIAVAVPPAKAGEGLAELKVEKQEVSQVDVVKLSVDGVQWRGIAADYLSEAGTARRERYLYTDLHDHTLYIFWDRGPVAGWEAGKAVREETLRKVTAILSGKAVAQPGESEDGAAEPGASADPATESGKSEAP